MLTPNNEKWLDLKDINGLTKLIPAIVQDCCI